MRPAHPRDFRLLVDFLRCLSPETLALRFFTAGVDPEAMASNLVRYDGGFALVALREGRIIGHAAYRPTGERMAEAAVVVADEFQGKGLGTVLLGQIAQAAEAAGVQALEAVVAPGNQRMIRVLRHLGYPTQLRSEPGIVRVTFPTSALPEAIRAFEMREAVAARAAVERFFRPRSVAVIGASRERGTVGGDLFHNLIRGGFQGPVYPVNSAAEVVQSVAAYRSVLDCPGPVDLALVAVPAPAVPEVAQECARKGVKGLVVISAGFAETGEDGARLQRELVEICREGGMRLIGPNCMGLVNTDPAVRLNAQFSPFQPLPGEIGFLSQSGALGIAIIDLANSLGLGMSTFVSVGNKADISGNDLIQYWEEDERTRVILLYLESFGNPRKFSRIARRVARKKPIVVVKGGRTAAGARGAASHTAALISVSDVTVDALFRQSGVIRTETLNEMFDVAALLASQPVPRGRRVGIVTNAGGAGILAADACEAHGLKVEELTEETRAELATFLPPQAALANPVDMTAGAGPNQYYRAITTVAQDPGVDAMIVIFIPPIAIRPEDVASEILRATREIGGRIPILTNFMASRGIPSILTDGEIRVPSFPFPEAAAAALARAVEYGMWLDTPPEDPFSLPEARKEEAALVVAGALRRGPGWLEPEEVAQVLSCYDIPLVRTVLAGDPAEAGEVAEALGGRVALKAVAPGLVHKTEVGGVALGLEGRKAVEEAASRMAARVSAAGYEVKGFLVQPMVPAGVEMLVGVTHDAVFGPVVAVGAGGVMVELLRDVQVRITPLTRRDAGEMVRALKTFPLLTGYRGGPRYDVKALEEIILKIGALVEDVAEVSELDLNPVVVLPEGKGALVVDARLHVAEMPTPQLPFGAKRRI